MAKYGSNSQSFSVNGVDVTQYIDTFNGLDIESMTQETHTFGDEWVEELATGVSNGNEFTLGGFYDDENNGPKTVFQANRGQVVPIVLTWGGANTSTFNALIRRWRRLPTRGQLTRFEAVLKPSGAVTEA